jgi:hypothetical protein
VGRAGQGRAGWRVGHLDLPIHISHRVVGHYEDMMGWLIGREMQMNERTNV